MIRASGALTSSQGRDYYEREYVTGDYYTEDAHAVRGQWSGLGAQELGLEGEVDKGVFESVLEGKDGSGKLQLIPGEVGTGKRRAGWDFTCSPEKSISIMALVGGDPGIVEDVKAANAKAMVELERFALAKDRDRMLETTGNLVIASFKHETSRKLDPQLHIHNVVMNMTRRGDGKFVALETREMFAAQSFVKHVFHADLAQRLTAEEKPFVEIDELKQLPNNVALGFPSTGEKTLPATYVYLRPLWVYQEYPDLDLETPWLDWPEELRRSYDLDTVPQECYWLGWGHGPLAASEVLAQDHHLAAFLQAPL